MIAVLTCLVALVRVVSAEVCSPTQCLPGVFNTTLGASFASVILLPGTYSSDSAAAKLVSLSKSPSTPSGIITSESSSFPYTVSFSSGALAFGATNYAGDSTLIGLSSKLSSPRLPASVAVPPNTAVTFRSTSSQSSLVLFAPVPDTAQLPPLSPDLAFSAIQSTSCSPACASGVFVLPGSFKMRRANVKFVLKDVLLVLRLQGCALHAKLNLLLIRMTVQGAFLQPIPRLRLAQTANSLTLQLRLVPHVRPYAKPALDLCQRNVSLVEPVNLWAQGIACPSTCTSCSIPSFSVVSTPAQITCSACLPGFVLTPSKRCERTCPAGTFVSPQDGFTCTPCDGACAECIGEATFCTACSGGRGALDGKCVGSCPSGTILSKSASTNSTGTTCVTCHADCATCSGPGSTQCSTCPPSRPLKSSDGRCLPASSCGAQSFFDSASGTCRSCDAGCASCAGAGGQMCTACPSGKVLQAGQCVDSGCGETYLGLCLSALVTSAGSTKTVGLTPLHGALVGTSSIGIIILGLLFWRRRARKQRAARTAAFADTIPDPETGRGRWEWGRVWRLRREEGWFSGLKLLTRGVSARSRGRRQFHREMSLRKLGGQGRRPYQDGEEDPRWRNLHPRREAQDAFVFDRPVVPAAPGTGQSWWRDRDSIDSERGRTTEGAYGRINPESHFARTLSSVSGGSVRRPVVQRSGTPEADKLEPDVTGASAHTFGVPPTIGRKGSLSSQKSGLIDLTSNPTGSSSQVPQYLAANHTGSDIQAGNWMLPNHTGMESVSSHFTGSVVTQNTGLGVQPSSLAPVPAQQTGVSKVPSHNTGNSSVVFHHTGSSNSLSPHPTGASILVSQTGGSGAPRVPLAYAPFLESSIAPQPRQPVRDGSNINPFSRTLTVTPRPSNELLMMSPPPQGIPSSPVWPGAVGGSYWYGSEPQNQQSQLKLGDKNPFRRI